MLFSSNTLKFNQSKILFFNPFPNKPMFLCVCRASLLKTLLEKKKILIKSNFFFSHSVFYPFVEISAIFIKFEIVVRKLFQLAPVQNLLFGKGLTLYQTITTLTTLYEKPFENIVGKGENAGKQHFLLFPQCFLPFTKRISISQSLLFCRLQMFSIWANLKFCCLVKN